MSSNSWGSAVNLSLKSIGRRRMTRPTFRPAIEKLEDRCTPTATGYRPIDEVGNNIADSTLGTAGTDLLRLSPADYADGISSPSLPNNPGARTVSDILSNQADPNNPLADIATVDQNSLSDFGYVWGQFIDHDMDLTPSGSGEFMNIPPDPNDPSHMATQTFERSTYDPNTGTNASNPRQQINAVTSYLDLSQVYGSTAALADALRTHSGGLMKTSHGNMLPYDNSTYFTPDQLAIIHMANDSGAVATSSLFVTGDVRGNENVELTALQTLFVRNHNLIASELQAEHPTWSDEQLYQEARKINIAEYQSITYNAYLPDLLGINAMPAYKGYNPATDPSIATEFSTVAFRFGHSLLSGNIERHDNSGQDIPGDPTGSASLSLATDFFDPNVLNPSGVIDPLTGHISSDIDAILKGDADGNSNAMDVLAINEIRNLLFGNGGLVDNGQDLIARDIQRARDDGIGTYNDVRIAMGLKPVTSFAQITSNVQVQQELQQAYGSVNNIDPFMGGLAEDHVRGSDMGPLFTRILVNQFTRLRSGDRFFYLNENWNQDELNILQQGNSLAKVIEANTHITNLQADVFKFQASISGTVFFDANDNGQRDRGEFGVPFITVQLLDSNGDVVATTRTDFFGHYTFSQLSGPAANVENGSGISATGDYSVVLVLPPFLQQTTPNPTPTDVTRGDTNVFGQDFGVDFSFSGPSGGWGHLFAGSGQSNDYGDWLNGGDFNN
jgi:peroxidase